MRILKSWRKRIGKSKHEEGFTFVETLAVLAIGAVLTAGASVSVAHVMDSAKKYAAKQAIASYKAALQSYCIDCGSYPTTEQGLQALWEKPVLVPVPAQWNGPYLDREVRNDPWGFNYVYVRKDSGHFPSDCPENIPYAVLSYGSDGASGGKGNAEDVVSWK